MVKNYAMVLGSSLLIAISSMASAQGTAGTAGTAGSPARPLRGRGAAVERPAKAARQAAKEAKVAQGRGGGGNQQALARQVRQAFAGVVRKRLNLNDEQARQLQASDRKFTQQRNQLLQSERQTRLALKAAMEDSGATRDQAKIDGYMHELVVAAHRRADLLEAEQKEMSGYLTPLQRAQYQALHEQLNKSIAKVRQNAPPEP